MLNTWKDSFRVSFIPYNKGTAQQYRYCRAVSSCIFLARTIYLVFASLYNPLIR